MRMSHDMHTADRTLDEKADLNLHSYDFRTNRDKKIVSS